LGTGAVAAAGAAPNAADDSGARWMGEDGDTTSLANKKGDYNG